MKTRVPDLGNESLSMNSISLLRPLATPTAGDESDEYARLARALLEKLCLGAPAESRRGARLWSGLPQLAGTSRESENMNGPPEYSKKIGIVHASMNEMSFWFHDTELSGSH